MRVAVLWTSLSGYMNACLKELASRPGVDLFVGHSRIDSDAPYDEELFGWMKRRLTWRDEGDFERLQAALIEFDPEVVVVAGWHVPLYRRIMKSLDGRCARLMTMDNRWTGSLRQRLGALVSSHHVLPLADAAWVPGHHQFNFARKIGFPVRADRSWFSLLRALSLFHALRGTNPESIVRCLTPLFLSVEW